MRAELPLVYPFTSRDDTLESGGNTFKYDSFVRNGIVREDAQKQIHVIKRGGLAMSSFGFPLTYISSAPFRGKFFTIYSFANDNSAFAYDFKGNHKTTLSAATPANAGVYAISDRVVNTGALSSGTTGVLIQDGWNMYLVYGTPDGSGALGLSSITVFSSPDGDLTMPFTPSILTIGSWMCSGIAYLNGVAYVGQVVTGNIYNAAPEDPTTWTGDYISASHSEDRLLYLTDLGQHIVAIGDNSIQFFYDAGNPTGSPLAARQDLVYPIGSFMDDGVGFNNGQPFCKDVDGEFVAFVGHGANTWARSIYMLDTSLRLSKVSDEFVDDLLSRQYYAYVQSMTYRGQKYLLLTMADQFSSPTYRTLLYDIKHGIWSAWQTYEYGAEFPGACVAQASTQTSGSTSYDWSTPYFLRHQASNAATLGAVDYMFHLDDSEWQDTETSGTVQPLTFQVQTKRYLGNSPNYQSQRKFQRNLSVIADRGAVSPRNISVEYSDDDYESWSTARSLDLSNPKLQLNALGSFYERAFRFTDQANHPLRLVKAESSIDTGYA